jgi:hypothetical protein
MTVVANPRQYKVPDWFLNRQKDIKDGSFKQVREKNGVLAAFGASAAAARARERRLPPLLLLIASPCPRQRPPICVPFAPAWRARARPDPATSGALGPFPPLTVRPFLVPAPPPKKNHHQHPTPLQLTSSALDTKLREDLERLKKIRNHRGLRHYWGLRVKGQHTKTTGRRGKTVGVAKKR